MRFPKPRRVKVHGNTRWLVRRPKPLGGGREYYGTKDEAEKRIGEFRKSAGSTNREFAKLHPQDQALLLGLIVEFDNDVSRLKEAALAGKSKVATEQEVKTAIAQFKADHHAGVSRKRAVAFYLDHFGYAFGECIISQVEMLDIERWMNGKGWAPKTFNECKQALGQFWRYCIQSKWAVSNPVAAIKTRRTPRHLISIYTPDELRAMLDGLVKRRPLFVPTVAIGAFAGLRISEIARVTWEDVNKALECGYLELTPYHVGKTGIARLVPILPNLRAWLEKYRKQSGLVLPEKWKNKKAKLGELGSFIARLSGVPWKENALRHSFGTYRFKDIDSVSQVVDEMGTSIQKFEKHYRSRCKTVTTETAKDYFTISPAA